MGHPYVYDYICKFNCVRSTNTAFSLDLWSKFISYQIYQLERFSLLFYPQRGREISLVLMMRLIFNLNVIDHSKNNVILCTSIQT